MIIKLTKYSFFVLWPLTLIKAWLRDQIRGEKGFGESISGMYCEERKIQTSNWVVSERKSGIGEEQRKLVVIKE